MNPTEYFLSFIEGIHTLTLEEKAKLQTYCQVAMYNKHSYLLQAGQVSDTMYFISKGLVRSYYIDNITDSETTSWIAKEGGCIYSVNSYVNGSPSFENIIALENTTIITIRKADLYTLIGLSSTFAIIGQRLSEYYLQIYDQRVRSMRYSAEERYQRFEKQFPDLLSRLKNEHIASYLGMCKASFSNIRSKKH